MKNVFPIVLFILFLFPIISHSQEAQFPIVDKYGGIYEYEGSEQPDPEMEYKIVIDLKSPQDDKTKINSGLNNVARMMNLHGLGGVNSENLAVSVVIHGSATYTITTNEAYQERYGVDNPNIPLITELKKAGAKIYVCGQSLIGRKYAPEEMNPEITVGLSMLTVFTTHVNHGFVPMVFN